MTISSPSPRLGTPARVPEYVKFTGGRITQTAALAAILRVIDEDATIITAGNCMQRMWTTDKRAAITPSMAIST